MERVAYRDLGAIALLAEIRQREFLAEAERREAARATRGPQTSATGGLLARLLRQIAAARHNGSREAGADLSKEPIR